MARINGYPESVKPGLPKLANLPDGWERAPLGKYLKEVRRPVRLIDHQLYRLVTIKRARGGVVEREHLYGKDIKVKSQFLVSAGDFLISKRQIVHGACGLVPDAMDGAVVSNEYAVLRSSDKFLLRYLAYLAESVYFQQTCFHSSIGVHIEKMIFKLNYWLKWEFNIPPFAEQKQIIDLLSTWDRSIDISDKLVKNTERQKKALVQHLLLPSFHIHTHRNKSLSKFRLGDYCIFKGGSPFKEQYQGQSKGDYPFIKVSDMTLRENTFYIRKSNNWIDEETRKKIKAAVIPAGAIVFAKVGAALLLNRRRILDRDTIIDNNMMAAIPKPPVDRDFFYHFLDSLDFARYVQEGAVPSVNQGELSAIKVAFPAPQTQREIARVLTVADLDLEAYRRQHACLLREKAALMQQLLTGKRRMQVSGRGGALTSG